MTNEILFLICVILLLGSVLLMFRIFGRNGLYACAVFGTLLGNIAVCKCITLLGLETTGGNILYASTFLITDILSEIYGKKEASKAVALSFTAMLLWFFGTQAVLLFEPSGSDTVHESLSTVFSLTPRITFASLAGFAVSQNVDVFLFHRIRNKTGEKWLWIRNNAATMVSQALDTVIFTVLAFWGRYPADIFVSILMTTYLFKVIVALMDTPFVYLAKKITPRDSSGQ